MGQERRGIHSVEVAFHILQALQKGPGPRPLKAVAQEAGLSPSAANNYLVSLVRTGLAAAGEKPGHYRLGPSAVTLGQRAIQQINGVEVMQQAATALRDATGHSAAVTTWTTDGPISLFKQEGNDRGAFELRTGLLSIQGTAAGRLLAASLPDSEVLDLVRAEFAAGHAGEAPDLFLAAAKEEVARQGFVTIRRHDGTDYVSAAAAVTDWNGEVRFALSLIGSQSSMRVDAGDPGIRELLHQAALATKALGGPERTLSVGSGNPSATD